MTTVALAEWQEVTPETIPSLAGVYLSPNAQERALLARLDTQGMITVRELRTGLAISTTSFVGSIKIGPLTVQIQPKIEGHAFSALLGYALGLPYLELLPEHPIGLTAPAFQDVLVDRLTAEATRLMFRGLYRHYTSRESSLSSPRGRILFSQLARDGPRTTAVLPCRHVERDENVLANRVLLAGLRLAARVALDPAIRARAMRAAAPLADAVEAVALSPSTFRALRRTASRLTTCGPQNSLTNALRPVTPPPAPADIHDVARQESASRSPESVRRDDDRLARSGSVRPADRESPVPSWHVGDLGCSGSPIREGSTGDVVHEWGSTSRDTPGASCRSVARQTRSPAVSALAS
jgi:hypothetical protein